MLIFHENLYLARNKGVHNVIQIVFSVENGRGSMSLFSLEKWFKGFYDTSSGHYDIMNLLEVAKKLIFMKNHYDFRNQHLKQVLKHLEPFY